MFSVIACFNKQCLHHNITPKYAKILIKTNTPAAHKTIAQAQKLWVKNEIRSLYEKKEKLNRQLKDTHIELANRYPSAVFNHYQDQLNDKITKQMDRKYKILNKKLNHLQNSQHPQSKKHQNNTSHPRTVNLTKVSFTPDETELLDKGLKYNLKNTNHTNNIEQLVVDTEIAITLLPHTEQEHARHTAADIIKDIQKKQTHSNTDKQEERTAGRIRKKLKDNNFIITKADKGNCTVIMTHNEYVNKTIDFIDSNTYKQLKKDPTK
uniref:Putative reverse transcriptase n=1 Tax=Panstrongylus lignarius TaxID=156445 RepID=A0A224XUN2_9HEMI